MRLPKQWLNWAKKAGLEKDSRVIEGRYMIGLNRRWRVNCYGQFECSCPLEHFDRWANSTGARWEGVPKTEAEFLEAVKCLVGKSAQ